MARRRKKMGPLKRSVEVSTDLRILGGKFRGSLLAYHGDQVTRPMKHRVREAIFNLLGTDVVGKHAVDLFAGTGAVGLEALSRNAASATFIERHVPTSRVIEENIRRLGVADQSALLCTSAFLWARQLLRSRTSSAGDPNAHVACDGAPKSMQRNVPWVVFCSPPYDFYIERQAEMRQLLESLLTAVPAASVFVVEADDRFDFGLLPTPGTAVCEPSRRAPPGTWRIRSYPPAQIGILRLEVEGDPPAPA